MVNCIKHSLFLVASPVRRVAIKKYISRYRIRPFARKRCRSDFLLLLSFCALKKKTMDVPQRKMLSAVLRSCAIFLREVNLWAARIYTAQFLRDLESMSDEELVQELTSMMEQSTCAEIAHLFDIGLQLSRPAILITGDIVAQRGDAEEPGLSSLMDAFKSICKYFNIFFLP